MNTNIRKKLARPAYSLARGQDRVRTLISPKRGGAPPAKRPFFCVSRYLVLLVNLPDLLVTEDLLVTADLSVARCRPG